MGTGIQAALTRSGQWAAIALGFSIPISVAIDNILLVIVAACWLAAGEWQEKWRTARNNGVALFALLLYALLLLGTLYGEHEPGEAGRYLVRYVDLLFIPLFAWLLRDSGHRRKALYALAASLGVVLGISYLIAAGMPTPDVLLGTPESPVVFKQHITHGILMAYAAFLFTHLARQESSWAPRLLWIILALAAAINVLVLGQGRSGYVALVVLAVYLGYGWLRWRGLAIAFAATATVVTALVFVPGPFQQRFGLTAEGAVKNLARESAKISNAERLKLLSVTLAVIRDHPLIGVGTGGFSRAYAARVGEKGETPIRNPHNEYLLIASQVGIAGLAALLLLFALHWRLAPLLATPFECDLARGLLLMVAIGCLFNSMLLDHTEGLLYAWLTGVLYGGLQPRHAGGNAR
jgi:O-antigen ligase